MKGKWCCYCGQEGHLSSKCPWPKLTKEQMFNLDNQCEIEEDAARFRWIVGVKGLDLHTDGGRWLRNGVVFEASHSLSANGTRYAPEPTLRDAIDAAMKGAK